MHRFETAVQRKQRVGKGPEALELVGRIGYTGSLQERVRIFGYWAMLCWRVERLNEAKSQAVEAVARGS